MNEMKAWQEFTLMALGIVGVFALIIGFFLLLARESDQNRDKDVHMMQECTTAGGTWLGSPSTCVQPREQGL